MVKWNDGDFKRGCSFFLNCLLVPIFHIWHYELTLTLHVTVWFTFICIHNMLDIEDLLAFSMQNGFWIIVSTIPGFSDSVKNSFLPWHVCYLCTFCVKRDSILMKLRWLTCPSLEWEKGKGTTEKKWTCFDGSPNNGKKCPQGRESFSQRTDPNPLSTPLLPPALPSICVHWLREMEGEAQPLTDLSKWSRNLSGLFLPVLPQGLH